MILYRLRCEGEHEFEGWFPNSASFERQAEKGLLSCPYCGGHDITRALMAPAIRRGSGDAPVMPDTPDAPPAQLPDTVALPDAAMALLQKMRDVIEGHCVNAGEQFAAEALKMHRGEKEATAIYGSVTEDEREMLDDEGVEVLTIPWVRPADS
ncbi:DUF1178 family protein [Novacetimonas hansenii]|uniref:DUF1178 family protein n=1 Tax=Novacetimonas hansenii TaxID=436 RepID=UPI0039E757FC